MTSLRLVGGGATMEALDEALITELERL
jgi:hypothetical protein